MSILENRCLAVIERFQGKLSDYRKALDDASQQCEYRDDILATEGCYETKKVILERDKMERRLGVLKKEILEKKKNSNKKLYTLMSDELNQIEKKKRETNTMLQIRLKENPVFIANVEKVQSDIFNVSFRLDLLTKALQQPNRQKFVIKELRSPSMVTTRQKVCEMVVSEKKLKSEVNILRNHMKSLDGITVRKMQEEVEFIQNSLGDYRSEENETIAIQRTKLEVRKDDTFRSFKVVEKKLHDEFESVNDELNEELTAHTLNKDELLSDISVLETQILSQTKENSNNSEEMLDLIHKLRNTHDNNLSSLLFLKQRYEEEEKMKRQGDLQSEALRRSKEACIHKSANIIQNAIKRDWEGNNVRKEQKKNSKKKKKKKKG